MAYTLFSLNGTAVLAVYRIMSGRVDVRAMSRDSLPPGLLQISGDPELINAAYHSKHVQLEMLGLKFRTRVVGRIKELEVILVAAEPLFRTLARHLRSLGCL